MKTELDQAIERLSNAEDAYHWRDEIRYDDVNKVVEAAKRTAEVEKELNEALKLEPFAIRVCEGGAFEDIVKSTVLTLANLRRVYQEKDSQLQSQAEDVKKMVVALHEAKFMVETVLAIPTIFGARPTGQVGSPADLIEQALTTPTALRASASLR